MNSTFTQHKTRLCKQCGDRQTYDQFPADKYGRIDVRMCLSCVDEHAPQLMTEAELAKWLGTTVDLVRELTPVGSYCAANGRVLSLYAREGVNSDHLPAGWRIIFDWNLT